LILWLALLSMPVAGQFENHLILKKNGYLNKLHFFNGDPITFIREGDKFAEESYIQGIGTDFIIVSGHEIPINKIAFLISSRTGFNFESSGKALMIASPGYLVIGFINELFHQRVAGLNASALVPTRTNLIVAGSLFAAGAILSGFKVRKYPIGKRFTLRIVQSDPALNR
jgi:hypothetical protein